MNKLFIKPSPSLSWLAWFIFSDSSSLLQ